MGAPDIHYVRASGGSNSNDGTSIGQGWATLNYAMANMSRNTTNGDILRIIGDHTLPATLDDDSYGTPTFAAPLKLEGIDGSGDPALSKIDGDGTYNVLTSTGAIHAENIEFTNPGSNDLVVVGQYSQFKRCRFTNVSGAGNSGVILSANCAVHDSHFEDIEGYGVHTSNDANMIRGCTFKNGATYDFARAINLATFKSYVYGNIFKLNGASIGVFANYLSEIVGNCFDGGGGTGKGVEYSNEMGNAWNNIFANFSGVGAIGLTAAGDYFIKGPNAFYNNTTDQDSQYALYDYTSEDIALGSDPFEDVANDDFSLTSATLAALRDKGHPLSYFDGNTTNHLDMGAVQAAATGGQSGPRIPFHYHRSKEPAY